MAVPAQVLDCFADQRWRLNNLYWITNKEGERVRFQMNWAQEQLLNELHYLNIILKARQLGFTTFIQIYMLDMAVFYPDTRCGVIAHTLDDAQTIFRDKIKFPYDNLPEQIRLANPIVKNNTTELELGNNSAIRVGTSLRSGTLQFLHVSEFGKICAKMPHKAREIVTGALNTLQAGQVAFIESTAEGQEGRFYDLCQTAQARKRQGVTDTPLDWRFHFYAWWKEPAYEMEPEGVVIPDEMRKYFSKLEGLGISLTARKRAWYVKKAEVQGADMKREYPSTPEEAFEASVEGAYYAEQMARVDAEGRIGVFKAVEGYPVHGAHDIGVGDNHSIWFFQILPGQVRLVGRYSISGEGMPKITKDMKAIYDRLGWDVGRQFLPHDAKVKEWGTGLTRVEQFVREFKDTVLVPLSNVDDGINAVRELLALCVFDEEETAEGIKSLRNYRKEWDEERSTWRDRPRHDWASHDADAFRYLAMSYRELPVEKVEPEKPILGIRDMTFDQLMSIQPGETRERA
jgi:hypothetical protein